MGFLGLYLHFLLGIAASRCHLHAVLLPCTDYKGRIAGLVIESGLTLVWEVPGFDNHALLESYIREQTEYLTLTVHTIRPRMSIKYKCVTPAIWTVK